MSISDKKRRQLDPLFGWLGFSVFCLIFSNVYDHFSHGVYSAYMDCLFLCPLAAAAVRLLWAVRDFTPDRWVQNALFAAAVTLTAGCLVRGVLEIAGTSSAYTPIFFAVGGTWVGVFIWLLARQCLCRRGTNFRKMQNGTNHP